MNRLRENSFVEMLNLNSFSARASFGEPYFSTMHSPDHVVFKKCHRTNALSPPASHSGYRISLTYLFRGSKCFPGELERGLSQKGRLRNVFPRISGENLFVSGRFICLASVFRERSGEAPFSKRRPPQRNPADVVFFVTLQECSHSVDLFVLGYTRREKKTDGGTPCRM